MKTKKIIAILMASVISAAIFAGCVNRQENPEPSVADEPEIVQEADESPASELPQDNAEAEPSEGAADDNAADDGESAVGDDNTTDNENQAIDESHPPSSAPTLAAMSADFSEIGALSGAKDTGFPGGPVDDRNRPSGPLSYQQKFSEYGARFIVPDSMKIYLTFDEGYENGYTSRILDILRDKNVKAAFFITYPYAKTETALVTRMIAEGHTLGNHSTKHFIYPDVPLETAAEDLMTMHNYVLANYGYEMSLFRPPEGAFSEQTLALAQQLGYTTMLWSFAYKDYDVNNQPIGIEATDNIVKKAHPGEIMLLHAVSKTNADILGDVIDQLKAKGFTFADYFYFK